MCIFHCLFHGDTRNRNQRAHIGGPEPGMLTGMFAHMNNLRSLFHSTKCCFNYLFRLTNKSDHSTVGGLSGINIQQFHSLYRLHLIGNLFDDRQIPPFAEIGNALNNLLHCSLLDFSVNDDFTDLTGTI